MIKPDGEKPWHNARMHTVNTLIAVILATLTGLATAAPVREPDGGSGLAPDQHADYSTLAWWSEYEQRRRNNVERLLAEGRLAKNKGTPPQFAWPIATASSHLGVTAISNFVDLDPHFPNQLLDYNCGERSYDLTSGYNHRGIDIYLWPFAWWQMDRDETWVVAAAPGTITLRADGNFDRSCGFNQLPWNAVYVEHDDGSWTAYGHLKNGSVTEKQVGDRVETGERLGVVGSSGSSFTPHLHMETYDAQGALVEPFAGACNNLNDSWWQSQREYYDSQVSLLATHHQPPQFPACPQTEQPNYATAFEPGDDVFIAAYYRDQLAGQSTDYTVYDPDGLMVDSWQQRFLFPQHYPSSYWFYQVQLAANAKPGQWAVKVEYLDQVVETSFVVRDEDFVVNNGLGGVWSFDDSGRPVQSVGMVLQLVSAENHPASINAVVGAMFTHDDPGTAKFSGAAQRWFTFQGEYDPASATITGVPVYQVLGGDFSGSGPGQTQQVGTVDFDFFNCRQGNIEMALFDGLNVDWQMSRTFGDDDVLCQSQLSR
ncbi:MAG: hypothetical protein DHS20C11_00720 [Lysobacteraceae bacterium]|nr:MAG: hypothetical protein DHS20C11_00720 [Xanthomonadaceae bacterium]